MAIHNLIGRSEKGVQFLSWDDEPIACLLLLCDQIQTWDRERDDKVLSDNDEPERAELLQLEVVNKDSRSMVSMGIEYVAPRHLDHDRKTFQRVKDALETILKEKPNSALSHIKRPWPFDVSIKCWLSGEPLDTKMNF